MQKNYILTLNDVQYLFFIDPVLGLCMQKFNSYRYSEAELIFKDACLDFAATVKNGYIYIVCQNKKGDIIYIIFDGKRFEIDVLLESKEKTHYEKHFYLLALGGLINLFYVLHHEEKYMLAHHIIDGTGQKPSVIDYITYKSRPFCVSETESTGFLISYFNEDNCFGGRDFRWSEKNFSDFVPFDEPIDCPYIYKNMIVGISDNNLVLLIKNEGSIEKQIIYKNIKDENALPLIYTSDSTIHVLWLEYGSVMSSRLIDGCFTPPVKYVKSTIGDNGIFGIEKDDRRYEIYGIKMKNDIKVYTKRQQEI